MALSDIAAGLTVTSEQRDQGVATVDRTHEDLGDRLQAVASELPCAPAAAATLLEAYADGRSVGEAAHAAELAPITGAKTLHLCGEQVSPLTPTGREILDDWLAGKLPRSEARQLAAASEREFALAAYVATHDPLPAAREAAEGAIMDVDATDGKLAALGDSLEPGEKLR
jgi:hypothetical protein